MLVDHDTSVAFASGHIERACSRGQGSPPCDQRLRMLVDHVNLEVSS